MEHNICEAACMNVFPQLGRVIPGSETILRGSEFSLRVMWRLG